MKYGVNYGLYETHIVSENGKNFNLKDVNEKIKFVNSLLKKDEVYMEFGAGADKFALACMKKGIKVFRIPTNILKQQMNRDKKEDASLILKLVLDSPDFFYQVAPKDAVILEIGLLLQKYYVVQEDIRKKAEQRLFLTFADDLLVKGDPVADLERTLRKEISQHPMFKGAKKEENKIYRKIDTVVRNLPIYQTVFAPIKGVGGVIAGRIVYGIQDIKRFPTKAHLKNYSGYGFNGNKEIQKRRKGETASWNKFLKQGVFLFTDQVNRRKDCKPWHDMLIKRKDYERKKFPDVETVKGKKMYTKGHIHNKAMRYVGQKFLEYIWKEWRRFEGVKNYAPSKGNVFKLFKDH